MPYKNKNGQSGRRGAGTWVRLPDEVRAALEKRATERGSSLSSEALAAIMAGLKRGRS